MTKDKQESLHESSSSAGTESVLLLFSRGMDALIIETTGKLLTFLNIPFSAINIKKDGEMIRVDIVSDQPSRLIGWHGETLNAVQHLVKSMIRTVEKLEKAPFLVLDTDGYRTMQEEKVVKIAQAKADFVRRTGARVTLPPMSPYSSSISCGA